MTELVNYIKVSSYKNTYLIKIFVYYNMAQVLHISIVNIIFILLIVSNIVIKVNLVKLLREDKSLKTL